MPETGACACTCRHANNNNWNVTHTCYSIVGACHTRLRQNKTESCNWLNVVIASQTHTRTHSHTLSSQGLEIWKLLMLQLRPEQSITDKTHRLYGRGTRWALFTHTHTHKHIERVCEIESMKAKGWPCNTLIKYVTRSLWAITCTRLTMGQTRETWI